MRGFRMMVGSAIETVLEDRLRYIQKLLMEGKPQDLAPDEIRLIDACISLVIQQNVPKEGRRDA